MTCSMDWISGRDSGRQRRPLGTPSLGWIAEQMPIQHEAERERYWKDSAAPVRTNAAQLGLPVWQIFLIRTAGELEQASKRRGDRLIISQCINLRSRESAPGHFRPI
jgi:hypothetical protein